MEKNVWIGGNGLHGALKEKTSSAFSLWKGGKITLSLLLFFLFALHLLIPVHAEGQWVNQENGWYYYSDGNEPYTGWIRSAVSGRWYYTVKGKMQTGWVSWKGKWYFLNADGGMAEKQWVGNFYVGEDGAVLTDTTSPDGWKLSKNGSYIRNGKPTEELNEKTARYIQVLMEHPDALAVFDSPSEIVLEPGNGNPFIIFKKMSLYDVKTSAPLYTGDAGFQSNAVLEYRNGGDTKMLRVLDLMQIRSIVGRQVFIDPAGLITYVSGDAQ